MVVFFVLAALVSGALVLYTVQHRRPFIPADADHAGEQAPAQCLSCHGPGARKARGPNHPLNDQCLSCHERA
jgi:hypothetical protein